MKIKLTTFLAAQCGISLKLLPENDIERELLMGFARHCEVGFQDGELRLNWDFKEKEKASCHNSATKP